MEWAIYELEKDEKGYWFYREGPRGRIRKVIEFQWVQGLGSSTFNLAFGDFKDGADRMDDRSVSNNHDRLKVLHTVATAVIYFLRDYPRSILLIIPASPARARLYQMMISSVSEAVEKQYEIYGKLEATGSLFGKG